MFIKKWHKSIQDWLKFKSSNVEDYSSFASQIYEKSQLICAKYFRLNVFFNNVWVQLLTLLLRYPEKCRATKWFSRRNGGN